MKRPPANRAKLAAWRGWVLVGPCLGCAAPAWTQGVPSGSPWPDSSVEWIAPARSPVRRDEPVNGATNPPGQTEWVPMSGSGQGTSMISPDLGFRASAYTGLRPAEENVAGSPPTPLRWAGIEAHPHLGYNLLYGTGLLAGPGRDENTFLHTVSPGVTFNLGPRWSVDYTPSFKIYSSPAYRDTVDQAVSLNGSAAWSGWSFTLAYGFRSSSDPLVETASQTAQDTHNLNLGAQRSLGEKTSLELGFDQALRFTEDYTDSLSWSTTDWLDQVLNRHLSVAVGLSAGYDQMDPGTDMTSERLLGRVRGTVGDKLSYSLSGGVEWRQFLDTGAPAKLSPTVEGSLVYRVFQTTEVTAEVGHDISTSYYADQYTESTRFGVGLRQRLLRRIYFGVSGDYSLTTYLTPGAGSVSQREDDRFSVQVSLSTMLVKRLALSVFYRYSDDQSDQSAYSFSSNQLGLSLYYAL